MIENEWKFLNYSFHEIHLELSIKKEKTKYQHKRNQLRFFSIPIKIRNGRMKSLI